MKVYLTDKGDNITCEGIMAESEDCEPGTLCRTIDGKELRRPRIKDSSVDFVGVHIRKVLVRKITKYPY